MFLSVDISAKHELIVVAHASAVSVAVTAGMTGYMGAKFVGLPQEGQTVYVSGAAGATGYSVLPWTWACKSASCRVDCRSDIQKLGV